MYVFGYYKFKCFVYPASLSCVSNSNVICTAAIKNIRNMHAVSTNQITDILHFNDKSEYLMQCPTESIGKLRYKTLLRRTWKILCMKR